MSARRTNGLRLARRRAGLSQYDIAFLLGMESRANISRHELGTYEPTLAAAIAYEIILGVAVGDLFAEEGRAIADGTRERALRLYGRIARERSTGKTEQKLKALRRLLP